MLPNVGMELKARKNISAINDQAGSMKQEQKQLIQIQRQRSKQSHGMEYVQNQKFRQLISSKNVQCVKQVCTEIDLEHRTCKTIVPQSSSPSYRCFTVSVVRQCLSCRFSHLGTCRTTVRESQQSRCITFFSDSQAAIISVRPHRIDISPKTGSNNPEKGIYQYQNWYNINNNQVNFSTLTSNDNPE